MLTSPRFGLNYNRLFSTPKRREEEGLISWIMTDRLPSFESPEPITVKEEEKRLVNKVNSMKRRKPNSNRANFVDENDLEVLVDECDYKCCITGWQLWWQDSSIAKTKFYASPLIIRMFFLFMETLQQSGYAATYK